MSQINLLPWREQERKKNQLRFGMIVALMAGLGFFCTVFFHIHYSGTIKEQLKRNDYLQSILDQESSNLIMLNQKQKELMSTNDQLHFVFALRKTSYRAVRLLNQLTILNPDAVTLYKVVRTGDAVIVFGKAKSNLQITLFMESIEKSSFFKLFFYL